ncbi:MAG: hypothetical protein A7316_04415 [Candidatus Altiarchaeales archaeon WOR_SM1_86-2]|nr:MAG: hypothetical protein A7316_04415 [Candidatus Altiarchaeales archaeon WOR_SM1_86-2]ODS39889.1 MAG: hypothetical protein A7315_10210 [Candidatus Altiarchaeales archaeon WOR_SM1_79]
MSVKYLNRRGGTYYLHEGKTKKGNPKYYFSKKKDGALVSSIPDGYEIYENPNAQVFLRRIPPKIITGEELSIVENCVKKYSELKDFKIDVKKDNIVIFIPDKDPDDLKEILSDFAGYVDPDTDSKLSRFLEMTQTYSPMMRFVLIDKKTREFNVERFCFLGSIDDWIFLDWSADLANLVKKYCKHLGKESFYELHGF